MVDDESPDGTGALVRQLAGGEARVHLLEGRKRGLGAAYVRGITHAMDTLGAEVVVQMDADFSHDPEDAGRLLARVSYGTFLVLSLLLPRAAPVWLQGLAIVPAVLVNYFLNSYWTFRDARRD